MNINELEDVKKAYEESKYVTDKIRLILTRLETLKESNTVKEEYIEHQVRCIRDYDLVVIKTKLDKITDLLDLKM